MTRRGRRPNHIRSGAGSRPLAQPPRVIDKVFPFTEAHDAYRYFQQGDVFGKVVIAGA